MDADFKIVGDDFTIAAKRFFTSSSAKVKNTGNTKGLVILGKVEQGRVSAQTKIRICLPQHQDVYADIVRLEKNRRQISEAEVGDEVGLCVSELSEEFLSTLF